MTRKEYLDELIEHKRFIMERPCIHCGSPDRESTTRGYLGLLDDNQVKCMGCKTILWKMGAGAQRLREFDAIQRLVRAR